MKLSENHFAINLRLFDTFKEFQSEIGKYENVTVTDLNLPQFITDCRKAFNKSLKQLETELENLKKGE